MQRVDALYHHSVQSELVQTNGYEILFSLYVNNYCKCNKPPTIRPMTVQRLRKTPKTKQYRKRQIGRYCTGEIVIETKKAVVPKVPKVPKVLPSTRKQTSKRKETYSKRKVTLLHQFYKRVKKLGFRLGDSIDIGIGTSVYHGKILNIQDHYIHLQFENKEENKYSLKNIKRMQKQSEFINNLRTRQAAYKFIEKYFCN